MERKRKADAMAPTSAAPVEGVSRDAQGFGMSGTYPMAQFGLTDAVP